MHYCGNPTFVKYSSFEIKEEGLDDLGGEDHKISNIVFGVFKIITPVLGSYKFSYIKLSGFNCLAKNSALQMIKTAFISPFDG